MLRKRLKECISLVLALILAFGSISPNIALANFNQNIGKKFETIEETKRKETTVNEDAIVVEDDIDATEEANKAQAASVQNEAEVFSYKEFLAHLKNLEVYAKGYAKINTNEDVKELVLNYVRTGVEKYASSGGWEILAGKTKTDFIEYVAKREKETGNIASGVRNLNKFTTPNGQEVELGHMFGTMNIGITNKNSSTSSDFGGWAGDLVDLLKYSSTRVTRSDVETMATEIREKYLEVDDESESSFGILDIRGDLDAYYLLNNYRSSDKDLSQLMEEYYTKTLSDKDRALYFVLNRFPNKLTKEEIRQEMLNIYTNNSGVKSLEAERGLSREKDLRKATVYSFADYLYILTKDELEKLDYEDEKEEDPKVEKLYEKFQTKESTLAPGVINEINYVLTLEKHQTVYYTTKIDVSRDDVHVYANYYNNNPTKWTFSRMTDQIEAAIKNHTDPNKKDKYVENYQVVAAINGDFYDMANGKPNGPLVMEGVKYNPGNNRNFFAILKNGKAMIGTGKEYLNVQDDVIEAIGGQNIIVRDGKSLVKPIEKNLRDINRASRSAVGITADNKVIFLTVDGRQKPYSTGATFEEVAQMMIDEGAVIAMNLDGGGSASMAAKKEGDDKVSIITRPSDGYERSISSSLFVVSTSKTNNDFSHALIDTEKDYLTVGSSLDLEKIGVSSSGNSAQLPEGWEWKLSDSTIGSIENDKFTAKKEGKVDVQIVHDNKVVGNKRLNVVTPTDLKFSESRISAIYEKQFELPLVATYNGHQVEINENDIDFSTSIENVGVFKDLSLTTNRTFKNRTLVINAKLKNNPQVSDKLEVNFYKEDETIYDFNNATGGNRTLSWLRKVSNSEEEVLADDSRKYNIIDLAKDMPIEYTFAIDMKDIEIPEQLEGMIELLPGGDDPENGAWDFLLQLAERISTLTTVTVELDFDDNLDLDISDFKLVHDLFEIKNTSLDKSTNKVKLEIAWIKQSHAIDKNEINSLVIMNGLKAKLKDNVQLENNEIELIDSGNIVYDVYLRSNTLYNVSSDPDVQAETGLKPFINPNNENEKGGSFRNEFASFRDKYVLDKNVKQGWANEDSRLYYYNNNKKLTGIHEVPGYQDEGNKYYYKFDVNGVSQGKINGLIEKNEKTYYAINGELRDGWREIVDKNGNAHYYYFSPETFEAVDGKYSVNGNEYTFKDKRLIKGAFVNAKNGRKYLWADVPYKNRWFEVDGKKYFALVNEYLAEGFRITRTPDGERHSRYLFDENNVFQENYSGLVTDDRDNTFLVKNGELEKAQGLVRVGNDFYYFSSSNRAIKNVRYTPEITNDLLERKEYYFDKDGKLVFDEDDNQVVPEIPEETEDEKETEKEIETEKETEKEDDGVKVRDGIIYVNGKYIFYKDGSITFKGLFEFNGDYYYAKRTGELVVSQKYYVTKDNGLLPRASYIFDEIGRIVGVKPEVETEKETEKEIETEKEKNIKNSIYEEDGKLYLYENNQKSFKGLFALGGHYYYAKRTGELIVSDNYFVTKTNDLLGRGRYDFDAQGRIIGEVASYDTIETSKEVETEKETERETVKNGIYNEEGKLFYYENNEKTFKGLFQKEGKYYYANRTGEVITSRRYYVARDNGLMPNGNYNFNDQGQMVD